MQSKRLRAFLLPTLTLISLVSGCGGGPIKLNDAIKPDPTVKWIFIAGTELSFEWGLFASARGSHVSGGSATDDRLILLCSLGQPPELLQPCRAYVLDVESGKVLKNIAGPNQTSANGWSITPDFAYVKAPEGKKDFAFDLHSGKVTHDGPPDSEKALAPARELQTRETLFDFDSGPNIHHSLLDLGAGRAVVITNAAWRPEALMLAWLGKDGTVHSRQLCELPHRPIGMNRPAVFRDTNSRLIFSWSEYVVCIDPSGLDDWNTAADGERDTPTLACKLRDAMSFVPYDAREESEKARDNRSGDSDSELRTIHVCGLHGLRADRIPECYRSSLRNNASFVIAVEDWSDQAGFSQLRDFAKREGLAFSLVAEGCEDIAITPNHLAGTYASGDGRFQGFLVRLDDTQLAKLKPEAAYALVPAAASPSSAWSVNDGVRLWMQ